MNLIRKKGQQLLKLVTITTLLMFSVITLNVKAVEGFPGTQAPQNTQQVAPQQNQAPVQNTQQVAPQPTQQPQVQVQNILGNGTTTTNTQANISRADQNAQVLVNIVSTMNVQGSLTQALNLPFVQSILKLIGLFAAIVVIFIVAFLVLQTVFDIVVILFPVTRNKLMGISTQSSGGMGMGMGMGRPGGMGMGSQPQGRQWVSQDVVTIINQIGGTQGGPGGMGRPGGMGMGMGGQQSQPKTKHILNQYFRVRSKTFVWVVILITIIIFNFTLFNIGYVLANLGLQVLALGIGIIEMIAKSLMSAFTG